jgi:hypothetical protein
VGLVIGQAQTPESILVIAGGFGVARAVRSQSK